MKRSRFTLSGGLIGQGDSCCESTAMRVWSRGTLGALGVLYSEDLPIIKSNLESVFVFSSLISVFPSLMGLTPV